MYLDLPDGRRCPSPEAVAELSEKILRDAPLDKGERGLVFSVMTFYVGLVNASTSHRQLTLNHIQAIEKKRMKDIKQKQDAANPSLPGMES